jgi:hypothetical protein
MEHGTEIMGGNVVVPLDRGVDLSMWSTIRGFDKYGDSRVDFEENRIGDHADPVPKYERTTIVAVPTKVCPKIHGAMVDFSFMYCNWHVQGRVTDGVVANRPRSILPCTKMY